MRNIVFGWWMAVGAAAWLALFSQTDVAAKIHGLLRPVTTPLVVSDIAPVTVNGAPGTRLSGVATIKRGECNYRGVDWDLANGEGSARVTAYFADPAEVRGAGLQRWEALMVGVAPSEVGDTVGRVQHRCGAFPVSTPFFDAASLEGIAK